MAYAYAGSGVTHLNSCHAVARGNAFVAADQLGRVVSCLHLALSPEIVTKLSLHGALQLSVDRENHTDIFFDTNRDEPRLATKNYWLRLRDGKWTLKKVSTPKTDDELCPGCELLSIELLEIEADIVASLNDLLEMHCETIDEFDFEPLASYDFCRYSCTVNGEPDVTVYLDEQCLPNGTFHLVASLVRGKQLKNSNAVSAVVQDLMATASSATHLSKVIRYLAVDNPTVFRMLQQENVVSVAFDENVCLQQNPIWWTPKDDEDVGWDTDDDDEQSC